MGDTGVYEGDGSTRDAVFTVRVAGAATGTVGVDWATQAGTASPTDFQAASGRLSFPLGTASQAVRVAVNGNTVREPNRGFSVALQNASGAVVAAPGRGRATIADDDTTGADLDGDGKADILWHHQGTGDLYVWLIERHGCGQRRRSSARARSPTQRGRSAAVARPRQRRRTRTSSGTTRRPATSTCGSWTAP